MTSPRRQDETVRVPGRGTVSALLDLPPSGEPAAVLALAHGAGAGMEHAFMEAVAGRLCGRGVAVLRYQFPYMESGGGRPDRPDVATATVAAAAARAAELVPGATLFAGGKSFGGRMTTTAAARGMLRLARDGDGGGLDGGGGGGGDAAHGTRAVHGREGGGDGAKGGDRGGGREEGASVAGIVLFGFPLHRPGKPGTSRADHLADVPHPLLFLQGTRDRLADLDLVGPVVAGLGARATLHVVEGADHGFHVLKRSGRSDDEVLDEVADMAADWMHQRVPDRSAQ